MAAPCYIAWNAAMPTTSPPAGQATGAISGTPRTMLQIAPSATKKIRIIEWGYTFPAAPTANAQVELVDTGAIFASGLTAHVANGVIPVNDVGAGASDARLGAALTGYATAPPTEGTIVATRVLDFQYENGLYFKKQFPLGREPEVPAGNALRIRVTPSSAAALTILAYVCWEE